MTLTHVYYSRLAAAFVRGRLIQALLSEDLQLLFSRPLEDLSEDEMEQLIALGIRRGLRLHRFKRAMELARVSKALGILRGLGPQSLLDIGSGRGAFLWPLVNTFPDVPVTVIDLLDHRVADIQAVQAGGMAQITALKMDATALAFADRSFDGVTMLEVLEHIPDTASALAEACRVAQRFLVCSVPSRADDNPEHIHLFAERQLRELLARAGARHVNASYVLNHMLLVATMGER